MNMTVSSVYLTSKIFKATFSRSMQGFQILKSFLVNIHSSKAPNIKQVHWHPPIISWTKCNIDKVTRGFSGPSTCEGIIRDHHANFYGCFVVNIGNNTSFNVELIGSMTAIELLSKKVHTLCGWIPTLNGQL